MRDPGELLRLASALANALEEGRARTAFRGRRLPLRQARALASGFLDTLDAAIAPSRQVIAYRVDVDWARKLEPVTRLDSLRREAAHCDVYTLAYAQRAAARSLQLHTGAVARLAQRMGVGFVDRPGLIRDERLRTPSTPPAWVAVRCAPHRLRPPQVVARPRRREHRPRRRAAARRASGVRSGSDPGSDDPPVEPEPRYRPVAVCPASPHSAWARATRRGFTVRGSGGRA